MRKCKNALTTLLFSTRDIGLVESLPLSNGCSYLLTCIDRYTRWLEVIPLPYISAATCANAFLLDWIARFGCPLNLTTDRRGQFCSALFNNFCINFGINLKNTTAYHPASNGIIENTHRTIKAALKAHENPLYWHSNLGLVLLGLRSTYKPDIDCSSSELLYGTTIRLPGEFFEDFSPDVPQTEYSTAN